MVGPAKWTIAGSLILAVADLRKRQRSRPLKSLKAFAVRFRWLVEVPAKSGYKEERRFLKVEELDLVLFPVEGSRGRPGQLLETRRKFVGTRRSFCARRVVESEKRIATRLKGSRLDVDCTGYERTLVSIKLIGR